MDASRSTMGVSADTSVVMACLLGHVAVIRAMTASSPAGEVVRTETMLRVPRGHGPIHVANFLETSHTRRLPERVGGECGTRHGCLPPWTVRLIRTHVCCCVASMGEKRVLICAERHGLDERKSGPDGRLDACHPVLV